MVNGQTIATWLEWEAGVAPKRYAQLQAKRGWGGAIEIMGFTVEQLFDVWVWVPCSGKRGRLYRRTSCFDVPSGRSRGRIDVCRSAGVHYDYIELDDSSTVEQVEGSDDDDTSDGAANAAVAAPERRAPSETAGGAPKRAQERKGKASARAAREASLERQLAEMEVGEAERDGFEEEKKQIGRAVTAVLAESESVSEGVGALMSLAKEFELTCDDLFGVRVANDSSHVPPPLPRRLLTAPRPIRTASSQFIFLYALDEKALEQITAHAVLLAKLFKASPDKEATQRALLRYVQQLALEGPHKGALHRRVPRLLKALYDIDILEESAVVRWYNKGSKAAAGRAAREAAAPFVKWLREAEVEEGSSGEETPVGETSG